MFRDVWGPAQKVNCNLRSLLKYKRRAYPAAEEVWFPAISDLSCSGSLVGGRQVLAEQTSATDLSFRRCGIVSRSASGSDVGAAPGKMRSTDLPNRNTELAAASSDLAVESSLAPKITTCAG